MEAEYTERPTKRRKLETSQALQFLDLEAEVSEAETDDENDGNEGDLIDDDEDIDESISGDAHRNLLREALMPSNDDAFWESFLERVTAHQRIAEEDVQDVGKASLWMVLVKPGYEERIVCRVHRRLMDPRFPARFRPPAVFGWKALPGRVFFEGGSEEMIRQVCNGIPNVMLSKTFHIPDPNPSIFNVPDTFRPKPHSWVRLHRGIYKGDLAFIREVHPNPTLLINLLVVPRVDYDPPAAKVKGSRLIAYEERNDETDDEFAATYKPDRELNRRASAPGRPRQALFNPTLAKQRFRRAFQERNSLSLFRGVLYDADGYAYFSEVDTDWYTAEDVVPTSREFELFSACSDIPLNVRQHTMARMSARILRIGDGVKITHGDSRGLFGMIEDITENEAIVSLTMEDVTTTVPFSSLRKDLKVGDEVRILSGDHEGVTGWVVNGDDDYVCVFNDRTSTEIEVSPGIVQFFTSPFVFGTESSDLKAPFTDAQKRVMKADSNSHLVGKQVMVTKGDFRGYRGRIKSTVGEKRVLAELEARLQSPQVFDISSLRIITDERLQAPRPRELLTDFTYPLEPAPPPGTLAGFLFPGYPLPDPQPSVTYPAPFLPQTLAIAGPSTPLPNSEDIPMTPAWNPSSQTPRRGDDASSPYWLKDGCFANMRLSLRLINTNPNFHNGQHEDKCGEFKGVVGDVVKVQLGYKVVEVPFPYLIPERPECKGQVVTAFDGPHRGTQFRIKEFGEEVCGCSILKSTTLLRKVDVKIATNLLVVT